MQFIRVLKLYQFISQQRFWYGGKLNLPVLKRVVSFLAEPRNVKHPENYRDTLRGNRNGVPIIYPSRLRPLLDVSVLR